MDGYTEPTGSFRDISFYGCDRLRHRDVMRAALFTGRMVAKGEMPFAVAIDHVRELAVAAGQPDFGEVEALGVLLRSAAYWLRTELIESATDYFNSPYALTVHAVAGFVATGDYDGIELFARSANWGGPTHTSGYVIRELSARLRELAATVKAGVEFVYRKQKLGYEGGGG